MHYTETELPRDYIVGDVVTVDHDDIPAGTNARVVELSPRFVWVKTDPTLARVPVMRCYVTLIERQGIRGEAIRTAEHAARVRAARTGLPSDGWQARRDIITDDRLHVSRVGEATVYYFDTDGAPIGLDDGVTGPCVYDDADLAWLDGEPCDCDGDEPNGPPAWLRRVGWGLDGLTFTALAVLWTRAGGPFGLATLVLCTAGGIYLRRARRAYDESDGVEGSAALEAALTFLSLAVATAWLAGGWS